MLACQPVGNTGHDHDSEHGHDHADQLSYVQWQAQVELFVEFKPLVLGEISRFAAHFTQLTDYKPIQEGILTVSLIVEDKGIKQSVEIASPGIFSPALKPTVAGRGKLIFDLKTPDLSRQFTIDPITVFSNSADAAAAALAQAPPADAVEFLKDQAWKIDFEVKELKKEPVHQVIHTAGEFQAVKGQEKIVAAKSGGIITYKNSKLQIGRELSNGELLLSINSGGLLTKDIREKHSVAKAKHYQAQADFERAERLLNQQIISQKEYEKRKMDYSVAKAELATISNAFSKGGQMVYANMSGIIKDLYISDGQYVEEGQALMKLTNNRKLHLQAEVSQKYSAQLGRINKVHFKTPAEEEFQALEAYNGRLVSYGKILEPGTALLPVLFELDNVGTLIPGSFAELFLLTKPIEEAIVVPRSALMRDYDQHYVYVQAGGESFEKRPVKLGVDDGFQVEILSGLSEGDLIVTQGAYQIKMASMSSAIPAHGHTH